MSPSLFPTLTGQHCSARRSWSKIQLYRRLSCLVSLAFLVLLTSLSACTRSESVLRIGINSWPAYELLFLAQEKGFFPKGDAKIRLVEFSSLSDCRRAYQRGQIDGLATTIVEVLQAQGHSERKPRIVYALDYSEGADQILASSKFETVERLRGARVGVELDSLGVFVLARALGLHGLSLTDVQTISMDQLSMEEALRKNELDAVVTYPPTAVRLLKDGVVKSIFSTKEIPNEVLDVIAVDESAIRAQQGAVSTLIKGLSEAYTYTVSNPGDAHAIMAKREGLSPDEFKRALTEGIQQIPPSEQAEFLKPKGKAEAALQVVDQVLRQNQQLTIEGPGEYLIDPSFVHFGH